METSISGWNSEGDATRAHRQCSKVAPQVNGYGFGRTRVMRGSLRKKAERRQFQQFRSAVSKRESSNDDMPSMDDFVREIAAKNLT
jgi:hypothetical protein